MFGWSHMSQEEYLERRLREAGVSNEIIAQLKTELLRKADRKVISFSMYSGRTSEGRVNVSQGTVQ
ncbi:hypothetical protein ALPO108162_09650 [Alicyclobacillus pomorum]|jgi:hypothetical protein